MSIGVLLVSIFTFVELNCENVFDCQHDSLKNDYEWLADSGRYWNYKKYWRKLNNIGKVILSCGTDSAGWSLPDMVALCEVENDTVLRDLTQRSLLRKARYEYIMTDSPDERGIDVALLYSPYSFLLLNHYSLRGAPVGNLHPSRDILYASGQLVNGDTLHVFVVHAPSRAGGERHSRPYRIAVANRLLLAVDSVRQLQADARIIVAGDFNDYPGDSALVLLSRHALKNVSAHAKGRNGAKGTYKYKGLWGNLDHIFTSGKVAEWLTCCYIHDEPFLLEDDKKYGGVQPRRTYNGFRYNDGFSDHLPLVARFVLSH